MRPEIVKLQGLFRISGDALVRVCCAVRSPSLGGNWGLGSDHAMNWVLTRRQEIQHLKKQFDYGDDVDLTKCSPHSISGLCKLYLRYSSHTTYHIPQASIHSVQCVNQTSHLAVCCLLCSELPSPLLTFERYDPFITAFRAQDINKINQIVCSWWWGDETGSGRSL